MKSFLRWFFISNGVIATDSPPKVVFRLGRLSLGYNSKPFRTFAPNGPSAGDYRYHAMLHHTIRFFNCKVCGVGCWGYKQTKYCGSWSCFESLGGKVE